MNYSKYEMTKQEYLKYGLYYMFIVTIVSYVFYDSLLAGFPFLAGMYFYFKCIKKYLIRNRKQKLKNEFRDMIDAVATALNAGYSIENSFYEAYKDMLKLYGKSGLIVKELEYFFNMMEVKKPLEVVLSDFAKRAEIEDITDFSDIFQLAKRNGGDFNHIIGKTVRIMKEKEETERDIEVLLSGKKYEQKVMSVIPIGIILYLRISSGNYLSVLYHNALGIIIMTLCLIIYIISYAISDKFINIHV